MARVREALITVLDTVVFETDWGEEELGQLRRAYPHSPVFRRYEADLAYKKGRFEEALREYERLLTANATDVGLQTARAETLESLGRADEARAAYTRIFELAPADEKVFRALVRMHQDADTLPVLLEQVRRLRTIRSGLEVLIEREIELLHRMGRLEEARELSGKHQESKP